MLISNKLHSFRNFAIQRYKRFLIASYIYDINFDFIQIVHFILLLKSKKNI